MPYLIRNTIEANWQVDCEWVAPKDYFLSAHHYQKNPGRLSPDKVPRQATFKASRAKVPDFMLIQAWMLISQRVHDRIQELEPGSGQYLPVEVARKNGKPVLGPDGEPLMTPYWLVNITDRLDAVHVERSVVNQGNLQFGRVEFARSRHESEDIVLDRRLIEGRHFWAGFKHLSVWKFASDMLGEWILAHKMKGLVMHHVKAV
jgi:hypothetical protein